MPVFRITREMVESRKSAEEASARRTARRASIRMGRIVVSRSSGYLRIVSASDRRNNGRAAIELNVEYKRLNTFFADYTRNISKGGTFIRTDRPLDVNTEFVFSLSIKN